MTMERLSMLAPDLARSIQGLDGTRARQIARMAAALAIEGTGVTDKRVRRALELLGSTELDDAQRRDLSSLTAEFDKRYWTAGEKRDAGETSEEEYLEAFARARAVASVAMAADPDPVHAALEAAYEAHAALGDDGFLATLTAGLARLSVR